MFGMIGIVVTFAMVFGGYLLAGGKLGVILHSLPFEMMMIGGALVGTFLGVFLAYALVAPFAQRLGAVTKQDQAFYDVIKSVLIAGLHQHATNLCVEVGRQSAPEHVRPSFGDVENALRELKRAS